MFRLSKPSNEQLTRLLASQSSTAPAYPGVGLTRHGLGYDRGPFRIERETWQIGTGQKVFEAASAALKTWKQFDIGWATVFPHDADVCQDGTVIVYADHKLLWSVNICRIIYVISETTADRSRFGFGYGTLPHHVEQGEERFLIEWDCKTDSVTYDIFLFSAPNHALVSILSPVGRLLQAEFRRQSMEALKRHLN